MSDHICELIVKYVATHMFRESVLLSPDPEVCMVDPYGLLKLIEEDGVPAEVIDRWMTEAQQSE